MPAARKSTKAKAVTSRPASAPSRKTASAKTASAKILAPKLAIASKSTASVAKLTTDTKISAMPVQILDVATAGVEDIQEVARNAILSGTESVRAAYDRTRIAAEDTTSTLEAAIKAASNGLKELQLKAIENFQANTMTAFGLARDMASKAGAPQPLPLSGELLQKQMDSMTAQVTEFTELTQKVMTDAMAPINELMSRTFVMASTRRA